jgi:hypothetical protein
MDDFLHNLRSGKLKQPDRTNRSFGDSQYKNKRNVMDRRKRESEAKETSERLSALKEILESVAETQKRMVNYQQSRIKIEERKAESLEIIARGVYRLAFPQASDADDVFSAAPTMTRTETETVSDIGADVMAVETESVKQENANHDRLDTDNRKEILDLIQAMRKDGNSWEKIARQIASQGIPTVSGRGSWRGVMVKNLYEKMNS